MSGHRLGGADRQLFDMLTKTAVDRASLDSISHFGRGSMRVDVVDLAWFKPGVPQSIAHHAIGTIPVFGRGGDMERICAHSVAHHLRHDACSTACGVLK